ncbi:MAG TPA: arsenite methyltransferase [Dermatophilaceae bacterium]|nr:arsenite methyltransferase [Dermatophilaceae bacterium]
MTIHDADELRSVVREHYGKAATEAGSGCCGDQGSADPFGRTLYQIGDRGVLPEAALAASLGCGNPTALAELRPGEVVLDLGSGGGIDVLLSARRVAPTGKAYGLDMTPEMHQLAQRNQAESGVTNAEFLLGTIENVPLPDASVDVIISNCVVNLAADKGMVFREAFRVLRPGGRLAISDIVLRRPLPPELAELMGLWTGCIAGALPEAVCRDELRTAGFQEIDIEPTHVLSGVDLGDMAGQLDPALIPPDLDVAATVDELDGVVMSAFIRARKPS